MYGPYQTLPYCMHPVRRPLSTTVALSWAQTTWMGALQQKTDSFFGVNSNLANRIQHQQDQIR